MRKFLASRIYIYLLVTILFLCGLALRTFSLGAVPNGLTNDEADVGYDAYSILKTGKDQWGQSQPSIALEGFGDYRPPLYTYVVVPSVALFDLTPFAVRIPAAIAGSLTVVVVYFLVMELWRKKSIALLAMFLLAVNPWHIGVSRVGIESTFGVFIVSMAILLFLKARKKLWVLFPSIALFSLSMYTYTSFVVFTPLFVATLFIIFRNEVPIRKRVTLLTILIFILLVSPIFLLGSKTAATRSSQVNFTSDVGIINIVNDKRGECIKEFNGRLCQVFENKFIAYIATFTFNYIHHFAPDLLVRDGTPTQYSVLPPRGLLLTTEYLFFLAGIYFLLKKRGPEDVMLLAWILLGPLPDSITGGGHYSRFLPILPAIQIVAALGVISIVEAFAKRKWLLLPVIPIIAFEIITFSLVYVTYFPNFFSKYSHYGYKQLVSYIQSHQNGYEKIIISSAINDTKQYAFYLFYTKYDPKRFQSGKDVTKTKEQGGWTRVSRIGNIYFLPNFDLTTKDYKNSRKHILLAGAPSEFPKKVKAVKSINDPIKNSIFLLVDTANNSILFPKEQGFSYASSQ